MCLLEGMILKTLLVMLLQIFILILAIMYFINFYQVLGDENRRQQYDILGPASFESQRQAGGNAQWGGQQGFSAHMDPEDLFRKIFEEFSGGKTGKHPHSYQDYRDMAPQEVRVYKFIGTIFEIYVQYMS